MDKKLLDVLKRELVWNCWVAQGAWERLRRFKKEKNASGLVPGGGTARVSVDSLISAGTEAWAEVHAILASVGAISRMLWPASNAKPVVQKRAAELHIELQLPRLPELEDRKVRNAYEHIEEDGPAWFERALDKFPGRPLMGWQIGDGSPFGPKKVLPEECFRYLNTVGWTLRVGDELPLDLRELMVAIDLLGRSIQVDHKFELGLPHRK